MARPREFVREDALRRAMQLFWQHGYEGTSLADLTEEMGINKPSLYAAFGSKEQLFREAVSLYDTTDGASTHRALEEPTARAAVEAMLRGNADCCTAPGQPAGCMIVLAAAPGSHDSDGAREFVSALRLQGERALQQRFERAIRARELPARLDCAGLAAFYSTVLNGLSVEALDGASRAELHAIVDRALACWDVLTAPPQQRPKKSRRAKPSRGRSRSPNARPPAACAS